MTHLGDSSWEERLTLASDVRSVKQKSHAAYKPSEKLNYAWLWNGNAIVS